MRRLRLAVTLSFALAAAAIAQEEPGTAITGVIRSQIDAFLKDDFATAFTFASPSIKGIFGDADNFGRMVRNGYPMVWRPETVDFGQLREIDGRLWQRVMVRDAEGRMHALDYNMIETPDGWQINGVQLLPSPGIGV